MIVNNGGEGEVKALKGMREVECGGMLVFRIERKLGMLEGELRQSIQILGKNREEEGRGEERERGGGGEGRRQK